MYDLVIRNGKIVDGSGELLYGDSDQRRSHSKRWSC